MDFVQQAVAQSHDSDFSLRNLCWRRLPRRAFVFRRVTPTCSGFSRPAGGIVGVDLLAKPLSSVGSRQHSPDFPDLPASLLASTSSQSLCLPSRHANILRIFPARRRHCWRRHPCKAFVLRRATPTCSGFSRLAGNLCRPRTAITERALAVMAGSFFPNIRKEALFRELLPLSLIFLWKSMIRTGGP